MSQLLEINTRCQICRREVPEGSLFYMHPQRGIVCEYCPEFNDGGVVLDGELDTPDSEHPE